MLDTQASQDAKQNENAWSGPEVYANQEKPQRESENTLAKTTRRQVLKPDIQGKIYTREGRLKKTQVAKSMKRRPMHYC
jgi:hypothetical protein